MTLKFTRHAIRRARQRNISKSSVRAGGFGDAKYLGGGRYKSTKKTGGKSVTVVYRKQSGRRLALTAWKNR